MGVRILMGAAICILPVFSAIAAPSRGHDGLTIYRLHAGVLDRSGWTAAVSTGGRFAVRLPCTFSDFTADQRNKGVPVAMSYSLGCITPDGRKFWVSRIHYKAGAPAAWAYFQKNLHDKGMLEHGRQVTNRLTFKGMPAVDLHGVGVRPCNYARLVYAKPDLIALIASAPAAGCDGLAAQARKLFASLAVE